MCCTINAVMTYSEIKAKLIQNKQSIGIMLNNKSRNTEVLLTLSYAQIKEIADSIYIMLSHTDIEKIDTEYVGSIAMEFSYLEEILLNSSQSYQLPTQERKAG
ncbi:hypothetical protein [Anaerosinus gibii]|uniref:Uncharacterized protein n=1 Tax=Selenobaculum gibii TaxID=3054208 RepID=A0A9Y2AGU1_9FIRM|nr:hypothetical protein [Selenobaculum gbiensis]WIW69867.1 hypothetical protein P3F81_08035 [Selenobaculum gbiensis]